MMKAVLFAAALALVATSASAYAAATYGSGLKRVHSHTLVHGVRHKAAPTVIRPVSTPVKDIQTNWNVSY